MGVEEEKVVAIKKEQPEMKEVKRILTMDQGAKLVEINTSIQETMTSLRIFRTRLNNLTQERKGFLKAFDLPLETDIHFDEKTFEVKYSIPEKEVL